MRDRLRDVDEQRGTWSTPQTLAHGVFPIASAPTTGAGTSCTTTALDNCLEPLTTFVSGLAAGGSLSSASDPVLTGGTGSTGAQSLWNVVDNNGVKHRD